MKPSFSEATSSASNDLQTQGYFYADVTKVFTENDCPTSRKFSFSSSSYPVNKRIKIVVHSVQIAKWREFYLSSLELKGLTPLSNRYFTLSI